MPSCPACAKGTPEHSRFCPSCGHDLTSNTFNPTRTSAPPYAAAPVESQFVPGTVLAGRYRIVGLLGRGGMGEVYRADDLKLGQGVALKFLPQDVDREPDRRARFLNEVRLARQISHANVCRVYDIGEVDGRQFLSMEYVDGEDLAALLRRIGHLPREKAIQIARQLCAGLAAAHEQGVLHRDLKPANVMIDGRGRARITDFGLATLAGADGQERGAGTPIYMAPETIAGGAATVRSDLYALGLVLYELFTGQRPFSASTLEELVRLRQESAPTSPASHVEGFDPAVERAILRCLRSDPRERAASALAVASALPGGDPLAAALAAGETPSPELVAEAGEAGGLSLRAAWIAGAALVAGLALVVSLSGRTQIKRLVPMDKPPEVLAERARAIIAELGHGGVPVDTASGLSADEGYTDYLTENDRSPQRWAKLSSGRPPVIFYWYRQASRHLLPFDAMTPYPTYDDPPSAERGMISLRLDLQGRLSWFGAVPPERDESWPSGPEPDTALLLAQAGLDERAMKPAAPLWGPPSAFDRRFAWEGTYPEAPELPIRIEAASYHGRWVSMRTIFPWTKPFSAESTASVFARISAAIGSVIVLSILGAGAFFARRNLRLGRGDRKGAWRLAVIVFLLGWTAIILAGHYVASYGVVSRLVGWSALPLLLAALIGMFHLALEPYLRRIWPQMIVSWLRLLDGRWRDPLVGRDLAVGALLGVVTRLSDLAYQLISERLGIAAKISDFISGPPIDQQLFGLTGFRHALSNAVAFVEAGLLFSLGWVVLLLLLRIVLRRQWAAVFVFLALLSVPGIQPGVDPRGFMTWAILSNLVVLFALFRFGLLTIVAGLFVNIVLSSFPITADAAIWYSGRSLLALACVAAIALHGLRIALVRRPVA